MITDEQHNEQMGVLREIHREICNKNKLRRAEDQTILVSAAQPWIIDYKGRKHVFIWLPSSSLTLSFDDFGSGVVQAQVWTNIGMPEGIRVFAPNNTTAVPIMIRATDEVIP